MSYIFVIADIPIEMFIVITAGIVIIIAVIIVTVVIKCTCNNNRTPQENYPHFDANSCPPNYGYTSSEAHQRSSWACTFKGGQQANTHIWETTLPEPQEGEYTLPASMKKKQLGINDQTKHNQLAGTGGTFHCHPEVPLNVNPPQNQFETNIQAQYTMPVKLLQDREDVDPLRTNVESEYTMPIKMKEQTSTLPATSDYTIPVLPQPVPDSPDSESEYTIPTGIKASDQNHRIGNGRSSLQRIL